MPACTGGLLGNELTARPVSEKDDCQKGLATSLAGVHHCMQVPSVVAVGLFGFSRKSSAVVFRFQSGLLVTLVPFRGSCAGVAEAVCDMTECCAFQYSGFREAQLLRNFSRVVRAV